MMPIHQIIMLCTLNLSSAIHQSYLNKLEEKRGILNEEDGHKSEKRLENIFLEFNKSSWPICGEQALLYECLA